MLSTALHDYVLPIQESPNPVAFMPGGHVLQSHRGLSQRSNRRVLGAVITFVPP